MSTRKQWRLIKNKEEFLTLAVSQSQEAIALLNPANLSDWKTVKKAKRLFKNAKRALGRCLDAPGMEDALCFDPHDDLPKFVESRVEFDKDYKESVKAVYEAYIDFFDIDETSIRTGDAYTRIRFTRAMLGDYKDKIKNGVQRVNGDVARVFIGLRLKKDEEYE